MGPTDSSMRHMGMGQLDGSVVWHDHEFWQFENDNSPHVGDSQNGVVSTENVLDRLILEMYIFQVKEPSRTS